MKKSFLALMTITAVLCACNKEQMMESEVTDSVVEPCAPLEFTANMETVPSSKVTIDDKTPNWEAGDQISIDGFPYEAKTAGAATTFSEAKLMRPTFVSSTNTKSLNNSNPASNLVDVVGTDTRWCASTDHKVDGVWNIVVSTGRNTQLKSILLWNAQSGSGSYRNRLWKKITVYGSLSSTEGWEEIKTFDDLELTPNNYALAGTIAIDATKAYTFYRIDVAENTGDTWMQMSDMKFEVAANWVRPTFVSSANTQWYGNNPASNLVDDGGTSTRWCASNEHKVDGVWDIVVTTGSPTRLKDIILWNAQSSGNYRNRPWKKVTVYGSMSASEAWEEIRSFDDLALASNDYDLAGTVAINAAKGYSFYKIDVADNKGDTYMQMSDMMFVIEPAAPYHAYFPASLYDGQEATLPSFITETWVEGKFNMPMYAQSSTSELNFKNLCGVLKISVNNVQFSKVQSIRVSSANKALSGKFTVDSNNSAVLTNASAIANNITIMYTEAVPTTEEGTSFYIPVPAQTYRNLKIEVSSDGISYKPLTTADNVDVTVERNKIYSIQFAYQIPFGTGYTTAKISGKDVDVRWIQLWEDSPKWAEYNVGVTDGKMESYGGYYKQPGVHEFARENWGSNWRMPTKTEVEDLIHKATLRFTYVNGIGGMLFTGIGDYQHNSVFLPAAGEIIGTHYSGLGTWSCYWTSTPSVTGSTYYYLDSNHDAPRVIQSDPGDAKPVRAVCTK